MADNGFLSVSELSFDGIKSNLKEFLKEKSLYKDYDFEGSNLSALLDIMAYNTYMNSYYLNMVGSEMFLDSSQLKSSAISHAKELNYLPRSRTSPKALVTFTIDTGGAAPSTVVIPENYTLRATVDNINMDFTTNEDIIIYPIDGVYQSDPVYVYEGKVVYDYFTVNVNDGIVSFPLSSENVDTDSIKVTVINSSTNSANSDFLVADNIFNLNSNSNIFFVQGYRDNQYEIVFGDGVSGKELTNGNIVKVKYRSTNGELGNRVSTFSTTSKIGTYNVNVITNNVAADGSEREDINSIKFYAPRHYTSQNRAVTKEDWVTLIRRKYPQIKTVSVYGGEEATPPQYGKAIITMIPNGSVPIVSSSLKTDIINYLKTKTITTEPIIKDPEYLFVEVTASVNYNVNITTKSTQQIKTDVITAIQSYDNLYLTEFGSDLRRSKLIGMIDNADPSIISNDVAIRAIYKIAPIRTVSNRFEFSFSNPLYRPVLYTYAPGEVETIRSSDFTYTKDNIQYTARMSDDGNGNLRIYYVSSGSLVNILESNIGTVNYTTGELFFDITVENYVSTIDIFAKTNVSDIVVLETKFLKIDYAQIDVTVTPLLI